MDERSVPSTTNDLVLRDRAAVVGDALVVADLHLGKGRAAGIELPVGDGAGMVERLAALLAEFEPATLVLAGDVLHSFGTVPRTVADAFDGIAAAAEEVGTDVTVLRGNHDAMLAEVWDGTVRSELRVGDTLVCHGHEPPSADAERYVVGHDHPTIAVQARRRPCYLAGDGVFDGSDLLVLPAFNRLLRGVAVNDMDATDFQSPLVTDVNALSPVVWDGDGGKALPFPPLGEFRHRL